MNRETKLKATVEKEVFAPLGKYAAIAVLLVGIIVTTAIMIDKQLNSVESQIADIESETVKLNATGAGSAKTMAQPAVLSPEKTPSAD